MKEWVKLKVKLSFYRSCSIWDLFPLIMRDGILSHLRILFSLYKHLFVELRVQSLLLGHDYSHKRIPYNIATSLCDFVIFQLKSQWRICEVLLTIIQLLCDSRVWQFCEQCDICNDFTSVQVTRFYPVGGG